ncbi:MAG TPA: PqqD family protein [Thermoanaerobaculia bacterium]|nr:PqqD family protein [Thermoanaerobaculia bacterium]
MNSSPSIRLKIPEKVLFRDLDGEAVLLDLKSGQYFGLNEVGTRIWNLIVAHGAVEPAWLALCAEFDAPADRLRSDLMSFLERLIARGLLESHAD